MKLCAVISSLGTGGAERVMSMLLNEWVRDGHEISLVTLNSETEDAYEIDSRVRRIKLALQRESKNPLQAMFQNFIRIATLRKTIKFIDAEIVLSFITATNILVILSCAGLGKRVFVSERSDPAATPLPAIWKWLRPLAYRACQRVIVQTNNSASFFERHLDPDRIEVVRNPVTPDFFAARAVENTNDIAPAVDWNHAVIAVGRLVPEKGYDMLLSAFSVVSRTSPNWQLVILGEGPCRNSLERQIVRDGLTTRVHLLGNVSKVKPYLDKAQLFVLSSRFEGFPNALLEAMASGLPVISFACPSGPTDIILHNENGQLVEEGNTEALASAIQELISNATMRARLGRAAANSAIKYNLNEIKDEWLNLFRS